MILLKYVFVILHVITGAAWFGLGLRLAGKARMVTTSDVSVARALADDTARSVYLMNIFVVLTLLFSVGAFFAGGAAVGKNAFAFYGPTYHTSLLLMVILTVVQLFVIRTGWNTLQMAMDSGDSGEFIESGRKRVAMGTGIGHLTWLVILVLMFWPQLSAGL